MSIRVIRPEDGAVIFDERRRIEQVDRPKGEPDHGIDLVYLRVWNSAGEEPLVLAFPPEWVQGLTHVHVDEASLDCDGPHEDGHIERGDIRTQFDGYDLFLTFNGAGTFEKTVDELGLYEIHVSAPTDEGWHSITFRECTSGACNLDERSHRDVYAEQAGY